MGNKKREQARKTDKSNLKQNERNMRYSARITTATFNLHIGDLQCRRSGDGWKGVDTGLVILKVFRGFSGVRGIWRALLDSQWSLSLFKVQKLKDFRSM